MVEVDYDTGSFQDIVRRRQQAQFVARDEQMALFAANLKLSPQDPRRRFVFGVHGDGGVGKTSLLRQLQRIANEHGAATAYLDETLACAPEALQAIAADLARRGERLPDFSKSYDRYRKHRHDVEADPSAPPGVATFITRNAVAIGVRASRTVPGIGALASAVDASALADQAEQLRVFLGKKFAHHEDVRMLVSPMEVLAPAFVRELARVGKRRPLALFFDTYEQTGPWLDQWLRAMLGGAFGDLPENLTITIAGRSGLDRNLWAPFLSVLTDLPLAPFTDAEACRLLAGRGITDARVVEVIMSVSGRLPLMLAMLAQNQPTDPGAVGDPSGDAVERFLKWELNPQCRALALAGAFPRSIDEDILEALLDPEIYHAGPTGSFNWLRAQSFVAHHAGRCQYHEVVRSAMLRLQRHQSPGRWRDLHLRLAHAYRSWREALCADDEWNDPTWQRHKLEETYHRLCADPTRTLHEAASDIVRACADSVAAATRWAQTITQAGNDADNIAIRDWGARLEASLRQEADHAQIACLSLLLTERQLPNPIRAIALRTRGQAKYRLDAGNKDLSDFDEAIALSPDDAKALAYRGNAHRWLRQYDQALTDLDRAIDLVPNDDWALAVRGDLYRRLGRYHDALADLDHATQLNTANSFAASARGLTRHILGRYVDALTDLNRAVELNPANYISLTNRGRTYLAMGRYDEALADFDHATELSPSSPWPFVSRGRLYRKLNRRAEALTNLDHALSLHPTNGGAFANRAITHFQLGQYDQALRDIDCAIELSPNRDWFRYQRALSLLARGEHDQAQLEIAHAIELAEAAVASGASPLQSRLNLISYRAAQGHFSQAHQIARDSLGTTPDAHHVREIVEALRELEKIPGVDRVELDRLIESISHASPHP